MYLSGTSFWRIYLPLIILFGLVGAFTSSAQAKEVLSPQIAYDQPTMASGRDGSVYVRIHFRIPDRPRPEGPRDPINMALVIDRSGSMSDVKKMTYAKQAAATIIERLTPSDTLSVVEYDDEVTVLWPSSRVTDPQAIIRRIEGLSPRGSTNLAGGMVAGVREIKPRAHPGLVSRVILLSDGLANEGETSPGRIGAMAREARGSGVSITTMGLGRDYNEDLMQQIAEGGGGRYYYVENPRALNRFFAHEMDSMVQTVATNVHLRLDFEGIVKEFEFYGPKGGTIDEAVDLPMQDFYAGEERTMLVKLNLAALSEGTTSLGTMRMDYVEKETGATRTHSFPLQVLVSADQAAVAAAFNKEVAVEAVLFEAEAVQKKAIDKFEAGDHAGAKNLFSQLGQSLTASNETYEDEALARRLEAVEVDSTKLEEAMQSRSAAQDYSKANKVRMYQASKGKRAGYQLGLGDKGLEVEQLQQALRDGGVYTGPVDGVFDDEVKQALQSYQQQNQLGADGVAGPKTQNSLGLY
jgi:Ca-activated chloride channel homolog